MAQYSGYLPVHKTFYYGLNDGKDYEINFDKHELREAAELSEIYQGLGDFNSHPMLEEVIERLIQIKQEGL